MIDGISVNKEAMRAAATEGYATATDLADYLVKKGLPFRDAHEAVARAVRYAADKGKDLAALEFRELREFSPLIEPDALHKLSLEGSLAARDHIGGTAPSQVRAAIVRARAALAAG
jgi:argininosuccinate lyase